MNMVLPDLPPHEDKITYPKSRDKQTNREKKRDERLDMKSQQKKLKKEKHQSNDDSQEREDLDGDAVHHHKTHNNGDIEGGLIGDLSSLSIEPET